MRLLLFTTPESWCYPCSDFAEVIKLLTKNHKLEFEVYTHGDDESEACFDKYEVAALPQLVLVKARGAEVSRLVGAHPYEDAEAFIRTHSKLIK